MMSPSNRLHYLDCFRAVLFILGIIFHAAVLCLDRDRTHIIQAIASGIHSFRMQAFFLIGGFFSALMLSRYSPTEFLKRRAMRLGVPALFVGLVLNSWANHFYLAKGEGFNFLSRPDYWLGGEWVQHLWFLNVFFTYVLLLTLIQARSPQLGSRIRGSRFGLPVFLGMVALAYFILIHVDKLAPWHGWETVVVLFEPYSWFLYLAYFAAGAVLHYRPDLMNRLIDAWGWNVTSLAGYLMASAWAPTMVGTKYFLQCWQCISILNICGLLLWTARRFCERERPWISYLSDSAYTVYLVHWPILISVYYPLQAAALPVGACFLVLVVVTATLSHATHVMVVQQWSVAALLLNGRRLENLRPPKAVLRRKPFFALGTE